MARKESTAAKQNKASKKNSAPASACYWQISRTGIMGATKEELKAERRELNAAAGVYEVETTVEGKKIEAAPSNTWPYRITKGPAHPRLNG